MRGNHPSPFTFFSGRTLAWSLGSLLALLAGAAAAPFTSATVTRLQNKVSYGERRSDSSALRKASVADVIRANQFLLSEAESRAELQYPDGTLVRIGQNTVFTFDADSRTLSLDRGSLLFHIPKGSGGGAIKTPSLTAAITGTTGKVSSNIIAIIEGEVKLVPSGQVVRGGFFARREGDGSITVAPFDPATQNNGYLVNWNGLMPGFEREYIAQQPQPPDLRYLEVLQRTQNLPNSVEHFFPEPEKADRPKRNTKAPPRRNTERDSDNSNY